MKERLSRNAIKRITLLLISSLLNVKVNGAKEWKVFLRFITAVIHYVNVIDISFHRNISNSFYF